MSPDHPDARYQRTGKPPSRIWVTIERDPLNTHDIHNDVHGWWDPLDADADGSGPVYEYALVPKPRKAPRKRRTAK